MNHQLKLSFFAVFLSCITFSGKILAQTPNTDVMLQQAIEAKKNNQLKESERIAMDALEIAPDYIDFHVLLGSIYLQQQLLDQAIEQYNIALTNTAYYKVASDGIASAYLQKKDYSKALKLYKELKDNFPENDIYKKKIIDIYLTNEEFENALTVAKFWLEKKPKSKEAKYYFKLIQSHEIATKQNEIGFSFMPSFYNSDQSYILSLDYIKKFADKKHTLISRINYRNRKPSDGFQLDIEDYWSHNEKHYSHFLGSYSPHEVFPDFSAGYSLFSSFPKSWELETGIRYITSIDSNIYSAVIGANKNYPKHFFMLRNFVIANDSNVFPSHNLTWRYFVEDISRDDFISLILGLGANPDLQNNRFLDDGFNGYNDKSIGIGYQKTVGSSIMSFTPVYNSINKENDVNMNRFDIYFNIHYRF